MYGLTLEEDEERLMRIAIRESAAESRRGGVWYGIKARGADTKKAEETQTRWMFCDRVSSEVT